MPHCEIDESHREALYEGHECIRGACKEAAAPIISAGCVADPTDGVGCAGLDSNCHQETPQEDLQVLAKGDRVKVVKLQGRSEMNGLTGTLINQKEDRWHVKLDDNRGSKLMWTRNLEKLVNGKHGDAPPTCLPVGTSAPAATPAPPQQATQHDAPLAERVQRTFYIVGSWDGLTPHLMSWDWRQKCFQYHVRLGVRGFESFQLLVDGSWDQCFYPDRAHACPHVHYDVCGPDDRGASTYWTIGRHPLDRGAVGARYEVRLTCTDSDPAVRVDWSRLGSGDDVAASAAKTSSEDESISAVAAALRKSGSAPATSRSKQGAEEAGPTAAEEPLEKQTVIASKAQGTTLPTLREFLQAAKPEWKGKDINAVLEKLVKADIQSTSEMLLALRGKGRRHLNGRLKAVGEKTFGTETLQKLREHGEAMDVMSSKEDHRPSLEAQLPAQLFEVVHDSVIVYEAPSLESNMLGTKVKGELLHATEETFDCFVHLSGEMGWVQRDMHGRHGLGRLLKPVGKLPVLACNESCDDAGPQQFRVAFKPTVAVREAPSTAAKILCARSHGDVVLAEMQTYHGWLRLADGAGWILCVHSEYGQLLRPLFKERRTQ
mmetsp:Transcript_39671/g.114501  ORF Transcript_39671/g.114501 Transcript_39671/m.114501 type:complete len:602 (-) Transcript_39671:290-2095(-)